MAENSWSGHNRLTSLRWQGSVVLYRHAMLSGRVKLVDQSDFSFHNTNQSYYTLQTRKCIHSPDGLTPDQIYDLYYFTILTLSKTFSRKIWKNLSSQFFFIIFQAINSFWKQFDYNLTYIFHRSSTTVLVRIDRWRTRALLLDLYSVLPELACFANMAILRLCCQVKYCLPAKLGALTFKKWRVQKLLYVLTCRF